MTKAVKYIILLVYFPVIASAQFLQDSSRVQLNFQQTVVTQYHPEFHAAYSGPNSLHPHEDAQTSLTTTLFTGVRLLKNTFVYFNPEIAGGAGLSGATGIAGFSNGETFRVGNPKPQIYVARIYVDQYINIGKKAGYTEEEDNHLPGILPEKYVRIVAGRFAMSDFFDRNSYSHDPRTQFLNWSLMGNGAYDYSANTRGYTWGGVAEIVSGKWAFRAAASMVPRTANASAMDPDLKNALAKQAEVEYHWGTSKKGVIRILAFQNKANMGNYARATSYGIQYSDTPSIIATRRAGAVKNGFGINIEQQLTENMGLFARGSWNDGKNETWMFTEIDNSFSLGLSSAGNRWKRPSDVCGIAVVSNGISADHQHYLAAGGKGFMVGDGKLSYSREQIAEIFYSISIHDEQFFITPDYQFVINPAYNKDRGPVNLFALRVHTKF